MSRSRMRAGELPIPGPLVDLLKVGKDVEAEKWLRQNREHPLCQPYLVHLYVQDSRFAPDVRPVAYFIRASRHNPDSVDRNVVVGAEQAGQIAEALWQKWERPKPADGSAPPPYPDTVGQASITALDEGDWFEFWKQARRHAGENYMCYGPPRFPMYWTATNLPFKDYMHLHDHPDHDITLPWEADPGYDIRGDEVTI